MEEKIRCKWTGLFMKGRGTPPARLQGNGDARPLSLFPVLGCLLRGGGRSEGGVTLSPCIVALSAQGGTLHSNPPPCPADPTLCRAGHFLKLRRNTALAFWTERGISFHR